MSEISADIAPLTGAFRDRVHALFGESLFGIYLYGALTFPDSRDMLGDIDFHILVEQPLTAGQRRSTRDLRQSLARDFPPLGSELDGYVLLWRDLQSTAPPRHQLWPLSSVPVDAAWALHCAHIRAGRVIALYGPDPTEIYPEPSWPALRAALFAEVRFVDEHLLDAPAYGVLNAARLLYSFSTRDVVISKRAAANWALANLEHQWHAVIGAALAHYQSQETPRSRALLQVDARRFVDEIWRRIAETPSG